MKQIFRRFLNTLLIVFIIAFATSAWLKLQPLFQQFDVAKINISNPPEPDSPGTRLDKVLLEHLQSFNYITSFDHVFMQSHEESILKKDLWIDQCEVSQKSFLQFVQWRKLNKQKNIAAIIQPPDWTYKSNTESHLISGKFSAAANGISYYDAYAYCRASNGRLPYRHEWVAAASGKSNRIYAHGNTLSLRAWPYLDPLHNATQSCGLHKETTTPKKIHDLNNNVSEWVQNLNNPVKPIIIGGNAYNKPYEIYSLNFLYRFAPSDYRSPYVGFRCVYPNKPNNTPWNTKQTTASIPAGQYVTGIPKGAKIPNLLAKLPRGEINTILDIFKRQESSQEQTLYITRHEITREQYANFMADIFVQSGLYADENEPEQHNYQPPDWEIQIQEPHLPVTNIDWWSAYAFANRAGGRLLSATEWTIAASNQGQYIYPWGNELIVTETKPSTVPRVQAVGSNPKDMTASGLHDMGGNVSEWTQSVTVSDGGYAIIIKGGNYLLPEEKTRRIDFKNHIPQNYHSPTIGFRVVFDQPR